jgi:hypothetical protein
LRSLWHLLFRLNESVLVEHGVDRLVKEGHALAAPDAEELERTLEQQPDDLDARARLLGYYARCCRHERMTAPRSLATETPSPTCAARFRHALWVIEHAPGAPLAAHPTTHIPRANRAYYEAAELRQQHVAGNAVDATLLDHAPPVLRAREPRARRGAASSRGARLSW